MDFHMFGGVFSNNSYEII